MVLWTDPNQLGPKEVLLTYKAGWASWLGFPCWRAGESATGWGLGQCLCGEKFLNVCLKLLSLHLRSTQLVCILQNSKSSYLSPIL